MPHLRQDVYIMTSGSPLTGRSSEATQRSHRSARARRLFAALAKWSDPDTMRGIGSNIFSSRLRQYAGVIVPACFFKKRSGGRCYLDECGKDACQRECEYLLEVHSIVTRFKKKGISVVGAQEEVLEEALDNLNTTTSQTILSDWP